MIAAATKRKITVNAARQPPHPERLVLNSGTLWDRWVEASDKNRDARLAFEQHPLSDSLESAWVDSINAASDAWEKLRETLA